MLHAPKLTRLLKTALLASAPVVSAVAQETPEQWTVVYIGDSWLPEATRLYVDRIEADFGVDVFFAQRNTSLVLYANQMLQRGTWDVVRDAKAVVVGIVMMNDRPGYCTDQPGDTPIRWPLDEVAPMIEDFLQTLAELVDPDTQMVRIALEDLIPDDLESWTENGDLTECMGFLKEINTAWAAGAEKHGFTTVDYFGAWNGPDGTAQPPRSYFMPDGRHLAPEGAKAAADLLLAAGYEPLEP